MSGHRKVWMNLRLGIDVSLLQQVSRLMMSPRRCAAPTRGTHRLAPAAKIVTHLRPHAAALVAA